MKLLEKFLESNYYDIKQLIDLVLYASIIPMTLLVNAILAVIFYKLVF
jgi:hypothetical protein